MSLYTAQYRYTGKDRLDITVRGDHVSGKIYAPTWDMVMSYKSTGDEKIYTDLYYKLITERWQTNYRDFQGFTMRLVDMVNGTHSMPPRDITLVCFCTAGAFCHRILLTNWLTHNWPKVQYLGERRI